MIIIIIINYNNINYNNNNSNNNSIVISPGCLHQHKNAVIKKDPGKLKKTIC